MSDEHPVPLNTSVRGWALAALLTAAMGVTTQAATFTVINSSDSGAGSLRQAILNANLTSAADTISFAIPGSGVHTITPLSPLPSITNSVIIDGTTQSGYAGKPLIELNGASAGPGSGLQLLAGTNTVRGLAINGFALYGIDIEGGGTNAIQGNFIGTDASGTIAHGNVFEGVFISGSAGNLIGGTNASDRNVISGNQDYGVYVYNAPGNLIQGNFIGTTVTGTAGLGNVKSGILLFDAPGCVVGGTNSGARNVISANGGSGVYLYDFATVSNLVQGNYIGTDLTGGLGLGNQGEGITVNQAGNNTLGGTDAGAGNVISANGQNGIGLYGPGVTNNLLQGNVVGATAAGAAALGNGYAGIALAGATNNWLGGFSALARNLISGNHQDGILLSNSAANTVAGNYIGVNAAGSASLPNLFNGLTLNSSSANVVGGSAANARNLISGNTFYGIQMLAGASANAVQGNFIGTDVTGRSAVGNLLSGIRLESPANTLGGSQSGAGNLISGNGQDGVYIVGVGAGTNTIQGNWIGTAIGGTNALGNGRGGIGVSGAPANIIGGASGSAGNLISGNGNAGIYLLERTAVGNQIQGNKIGSDVSGGAALGNTFEGIYASNVVSTVVGGTVAGAGNLISGNLTGIYLLKSSANLIQGNLIGTASDGLSPMGNPAGGIDCDTGCTNNIIGGSLNGANRVAFSQIYAGNSYSGVRVRTGALNNRITYNAIFGNAGLGIDLGLAGVTANDAGDADSGANNLQNFPVLAGAVTGNPTAVRGTLNSTASSSFLLQFFASPACDASGNGEGQVYLGDATVITGADGNASFLASLSGTVPVGQSIAATATDTAGNTSEFCACVPVGPVPSLALAPATNQQAKVSWTNAAAGFVLKQAPSLAAPIQWTVVTNVPAVVNNQFVVTASTGGSNRFYRLSFE